MLINLQNNIDYSEPKICVFGFDLHPDGECHLSLSIAGKVETNDITLFIICPLGYIYSGSGKLCKKFERGTKHMIDIPVICQSGTKPDPNGKCRGIW